MANGSQKCTQQYLNCDT